MTWQACHKTALGMNFLTRIISSARIILLPTLVPTFASSFTFQISLRAFSVCFQCWKRSSVAENLIQILKLFQQSRVLWSSFQKKVSLLVLKSGLNDGLHVWGNVLCKRMMLKYISWFFMILLSVLWNVLCMNDKIFKLLMNVREMYAWYNDYSLCTK